MAMEMYGEVTLELAGSYTFCTDSKGTVRYLPTHTAYGSCD